MNITSVYVLTTASVAAFMSWSCSRTAVRSLAFIFPEPFHSNRSPTGVKSASLLDQMLSTCRLSVVPSIVDD
ncbi:hypothetical protein K503DRAFT_81195 [Rhizopogon vinicolor AM-OR11-026]|uniref:Uncharacterized protein n=1 Tax=Rhizopogon vinicolor AM-OR11-026 TaxID=1314800 RepID=A0A1B7N3T0_9AGAM|nr:hypothetical protein K503DRAFT_81195 [Rhizopogon vinicolor AM-OR11-026]